MRLFIFSELTFNSLNTCSFQIQFNFFFELKQKLLHQHEFLKVLTEAAFYFNFP